MLPTKRTLTAERMNLFFPTKIYHELLKNLLTIENKSCSLGIYKDKQVEIQLF